MRRFDPSLGWILPDVDLTWLSVIRACSDVSVVFQHTFVGQPTTCCHVFLFVYVVLLVREVICVVHVVGEAGF